MRRLPLVSVALAACASSPRAVSTAGPAPASTTTTTTTTRTSTSPAPATAAFVVRLGSDTIAVERYTRSADRVEGDIVNRAPTVRVTHYVATLDAAGRETRVEYATRLPNGSPLPGNAKSVVITFRGDSAFAEILTAADTVARSAARVPAGTVVSIANSYATYETAIMAHRRAGATSGAVTLWAPGAPSATSLKLALDGPRVTMDYFGDPVAITVDDAGRILAVDGTNTTNKVVVARAATADIASLATSFGARGNMGQTSPRDTVRATIGAAQLWIDYGRPSVRGRTVWGGTLVPFGAIWRTGANAATQLSTSADLVIGGTTLPAGKYTLWTWPTAEGYQLVVNKETGQWGTEHKAEQDLARVPLTATSLGSPVEQFTFAIDPTANGGTIRMMWGDLQLSTPFTIR